VFDGALLHVRRDRVRLPDGAEATREYVVHPGAVLMLPILADGRLVLERQFRYPVGRVMLEFPAGKIDPCETPLATAQRELREETGYTAGTWEHLGTVHPEIGYSTEVIEMYVATNLAHVGAQLDDGEFLDVVLMPEDELLAAFDAGLVTDGKTIAALFAWHRRRVECRREAARDPWTGAGRRLSRCRGAGRVRARRYWLGAQSARRIRRGTGPRRARDDRTLRRLVPARPATGACRGNHGIRSRSGHRPLRV